MKKSKLPGMLIKMNGYSSGLFVENLTYDKFTELLNDKSNFIQLTTSSFSICKFSIIYFGHYTCNPDFENNIQVNYDIINKNNV